ncbi:uncharacterized protein LOC134290076 [Aedes albopictus]|uniref:Zinc finger PHD-type domain-containing protein n=1 Tax=Aedes albopictus TaxID=7160 RepID=A0ABM1XWV0_AEDAL
MPETSRFDCRSCSLANNIDDMVECEGGRGGWFHYGCVGFDDGKKEENWRCSSCVAGNVATVPPEGAIGGNPAAFQQPVFTTTGIGTGTPDLAAERVKRNLKLLEEQQSFLLREIELEQKRDFEQKKLQLEKEAWRVRYELLNAQTGQMRGDANEPGAAVD